MGSWPCEVMKIWLSIEWLYLFGLGLYEEDFSRYH